MAAPTRARTLSVLRGLLHELKLMTPKSKLRTTPVYSYVLDQYRQHQLTSNTYCKGDGAMNHLAETYLCLLKSTRECKELREEFKGHGERSTESTANLVGYKLPESYTENGSDS
ncbi:protein FMC1 homolog [Lingula anatina]|uniref:Protein FMC1 homolog n=1 Tax=Lingula anatina TaxID=7574 RepID=A0A1S3H482_LINAN|nr:protein FMC1 homolog [Lingula anatina]XP_013394318.1 protein FMC1 homolog [Lingula anatina]|eukprot:XP_013380945.1 protein FMC1 homolog [Lingula anatina]